MKILSSNLCFFMAKFRREQCPYAVLFHPSKMGVNRTIKKVPYIPNPPTNKVFVLFSQ